MIDPPLDGLLTLHSCQLLDQGQPQYYFLDSWPLTPLAVVLSHEGTLVPTSVQLRELGIADRTGSYKWPLLSFCTWCLPSLLIDSVNRVHDPPSQGWC